MIWILNLVLPGTGLILRRREWLGLSMAVVFAICGNVALAGKLIAPEAVPTGLTVLAMILATLSWVLAQVLCYRQGLTLARTQRVLDQILSDARAALKSNDDAAAHRALDGAIALDDENVEVHAMEARLSEREGADQAARAAWRRVLKLDRHGPHAREAREALRSPK
ncbi:MAG: hypothetical protein ACE5EQ_03375 [Phycisphaerae bacterium]